MEEPQINLNGWLTIKAYAKLKGVPTQNISMLVKRDKIEVRVFPELNNMKLVREREK